MKKLVLFAFFIANVFNGFSQTQGINYQAVIMDSNASNNVLVNTTIDIRFTILDEADTEEYQETHNVTTDTYGMINLQIGSGTVISSNTFGDISWGGLSKKLRVEIDFTGSGTYTSLNEQTITFMPQPVPASVTQAINDNTSAIALKANIANPTFTGVPNAPTAASGTNTTQIATTAFVNNAVSTATTGNFVDLTTNQTVAGTKTFNSNIVTNGVTVGAGVNGVSSNTAIGIGALVSNTAGVGNVAIGDQAGFSITGSNNVAIGFTTNRNTAEGDNNIAIGNAANYQGTSGNDNISLGTTAYRQGNSGAENIAIGKAALYYTSSGNSNVAIGTDAGRNSNADGNVAIGYQAGNTLGNGGNNTIIGYDADVQLNTLTNATAIGNGAVVSADNTIQLGNTSITDVITSGKITTGAITLPNTDGTANQILQTNGSGVLSWVTPSSGSGGAFSTASNVTSNSNGDITADDFVFGSTSLDDTGNSQHDRRMFFDKSKAAFRVGRVDADQWDESNVGDYSVAMGQNAMASGRWSFAMGDNAVASDIRAFAFGEDTVASEDDAVAMGNGTTASAWRSFAMGQNTTASGLRSFAMGYNSVASDEEATAIGNNTTASARYSTALNRHTYARSYSETAIGTFNTDYTPSNVSGFDASDRLFVIGNGTDGSNRSDALLMLKNGNTTLKGQLTLTNGTDSYTLPNTDGTANQVLQTNGSGTLSWVTPSSGGSGAFATTGNVTSNSNGDITADDFLFGSISLDDSGNSDHDRRMFFDKSKGAFRAGYVTGTEWDDANVANFSVAMGRNNIADGDDSVSLGMNNTATGNRSVTIGNNNSATRESAVSLGRDNTSSGDDAFTVGLNNNATANRAVAIGRQHTVSGESGVALGFQNTASGYASTALGRITVASGRYATSMGYETTSRSYSETTIGTFSTDYTPQNANGFDTDDRLFTIGNGANDSNRSDALIMLKNGNTTLKGELTLTDGSDSYTLPNTDGTANQVLTTDGSGAVTWSTPSAGFKSVNNDNMSPGFTITDAHNGSIIYEDNSLNVSTSLTSGFSCDFIYYSNFSGTLTAASSILYVKGSNTATNSVSISSGDHIRIMAVASDKVFITIY